MLMIWNSDNVYVYAERWHGYEVCGRCNYVIDMDGHDEKCLHA